MPLMLRRHLRNTLLLALMGWVLVAGVYGASAATTAAWRELFAQSLCVSTSGHDEHAAHHAACAAHCAVFSAGLAFGGTPPAPWVIAQANVRWTANPVALVAPTAAHVHLLPPARAPPVVA